MDTTPRPADQLQTGAVALADAVLAYMDVTRLARTRPGSRDWRHACQRHHAASTHYATLTGLTLMQVAGKVRSAAEILDTPR